jgi:integrase
VLRVLEPIWTELPVVAPLVRARIEAVLDWATVRKLRAGENPAVWKGNLKHLLPASTRIHNVTNHAAMPYADVPAFMAELRAKPDVSAQALRFLILTAARTSEVTGTRWNEIQGLTWVIPAERMKGRLEHRVPLSPAAMAIIEHRAKVRTSEFVFPGNRGGLHRSAMDMLLRRMKVDATVHGFRSSFKDWCAECSDFPDWVSEKALAHLVGDETRRAYQRGDLLDKRRELMSAWATYIDPAASY